MFDILPELVMCGGAVLTVSGVTSYSPFRIGLGLFMCTLSLLSLISKYGLLAS